MEDTINFQLIHPFNAQLYGPSGCGKTTLTVEILRKRREIINVELNKVIYIFSHHQPVFHELSISDPDIVFTNQLEDLENLIEGPCLVVCDDQMDALGQSSKGNELLTRFFIKSGHHLSVSFLVLMQNAFRKGLRDLNINTHYVILFRNPRDMSVIMTLSRQISAGDTKFLTAAYKRAVEHKPFKHLFLDLHPRSPNLRFWCRSNIFPLEDTEIYVP